MSIGQTTYSEMGAVMAGMIADSGEKHIESAYANEEIAFGLGVAVDTGTSASNYGKCCKVVDTVATDVFLGVAVHRHDGDGKYVAGDTADILRKGRIVVETTGTVTVDTSAYVTTDGKFTSTSTSNLAVPTGVFRKVYTGDLAVLEINLP